MSDGNEPVKRGTSNASGRTASGENMEMPSLTGIVMNEVSRQGLRRSSMFESQGRIIHGKTETHSRGSFSLKGLIDPAVGVVKGSIQQDDITDIPKELVRQIESKDSLVSSKGRKKIQPQFENTYRLEPLKKPTRKELAELFEKVLNNIPPEKANSRDFQACIKLGYDLANNVVAECHELGLKRYRFVCLSTVITREGTSAYQASRLLSDLNRDTWEETSIKLPLVNIYLQLYCIYLD